MKISGCNVFLIGLRLAVVLACLAGRVLSSPHPVGAQGEGQLLLSAPIIDQYPSVGFYIESFDPQGNFIADLQPANIQIIENGTARPPTSLQRVQPGLQITVAYNPGPLLQNHYAGSSNFKRVQDALIKWAQAQPRETRDNLSLATNTGLLTAHKDLPKDWVKALEQYKPDLLQSKTELNSLVQALDLAGVPTPRPGMKRALLYITPPLNTDQLNNIPTLTEKAAQLGVHVNIWLVLPSAGVTSKSIDVFQQMADRTGGKLFLFSGVEDLPDFETYLQPLRYYYYVTYQSVLQKDGAYHIRVALQYQEVQLTSNEQIFNISTAPANPIFLAPPTQIRRSWKPSSQGKELTLDPSYIPIQVIVEFPDGRQRPLKRASLFVDGVMVAENLAPPFEIFKWDLSDYTSDNKHVLQIKIEDELGLSSASIETPVEVVVESKPEGFFSGQRLAIGGAVLAAAIALVAVLLITGKRFSPFQNRLQQKRVFNDPVTQPVLIASKPISTQSRNAAGRPAPTAPRPPAPQPQTHLAWLIRVAEDGKPMSQSTVPLGNNEITFGSDPQQAVRVLNSPSVSELHARLYRNREGEYFIADAGSIAGTWVNYAPVSTQGARLEHGDLIHIGRMAFRFEMSQPTSIRHPKISPYEGD